MKTQRSASATTFRMFAVVVTPRSRARALYDQTPEDNFDDSDHCEVWYEHASLSLNDLTWVAAVGFGGVFDDPFLQEKKVGRWRKCGKTDCKKCKAHEARVEEAILTNLSAASTREVGLFARAAQENWDAPLADFSDPKLDTGHYDDGHAFGWQKGPEDIKVPFARLDDFNKAQLNALVREIEAALDDDAKPPAPPSSTPSPPKTPAPPPPAACANPNASQQATVTQAANNVTYTFTPTTYWVATVKVGESFSFTSTVAGGAGGTSGGSAAARSRRAQATRLRTAGPLGRA